MTRDVFKAEYYRRKNYHVHKYRDRLQVLYIFYILSLHILVTL